MGDSSCRGRVDAGLRSAACHRPRKPTPVQRIHHPAAQNAGLFLGQIPHPHSGEKQVNLRAAKSVIDCLEMLAPKTQGNLTPQEAKLLRVAIDNLRPLYEKAKSSS